MESVDFFDRYLDTPESVECKNCEKLRDEIDSLTSATCTWQYALAFDSEYSNIWDTECGNSFILGDETPEENNLHYCPYCGKKLVQLIIESESEEE